MAKKNYTKKKPKQTLNEFRAWLQGVEEMQDDDWIPSIEQWKLIRDRIDNIIEPPTAPTVPSPLFTTPITPASPKPNFDAPVTGSSFDNVTIDPSQETPKAPKQGQLPTTLGSEKTPDIDSSIGGYKSGFA